MSLELHPLQESDLRRFAQIQIAAFQGGMATFLFPDPVTEEYVQKMVDKSKKSFNTEPDCHWVKIIDTELGGLMIACAKWRINEEERTEEEIQGMLPVPSEEEKKKPAMVDFQNHLHWARKEFMGTKPFYLLHVLVTDPKHHRRGAGARLVKWGTDKADKAGLPSYLEASEKGRLLYARLGFEEVHERVFDLGKYGLEGKESNTIMIRPMSKPLL
ncbi:acyl-CoA N-acyltransferase [Massarina eburnea CBS 473.64]|uniref:Acyl-CoA N-acyltransferase n=1 Tax=Massarina eburnea CBS 473.64 TaxID=1395130 RepID=A0A6A6S9Q9_9PLEO|nr:acyl-CoA N-acyltransferase [Massarina eburnea CBS 473.64]